MFGAAGCNTFEYIKFKLMMGNWRKFICNVCVCLYLSVQSRETQLIS